MGSLYNVFRLAVKFIGFGLTLALSLSLRRASGRGRRSLK